MSLWLNEEGKGEPPVLVVTWLENKGGYNVRSDLSGSKNLAVHLLEKEQAGYFSCNVD